jgi:hypothetical protein
MLDQVLEGAAVLTDHTEDCDWKTLGLRRMITRLCALFKAVVYRGGFGLNPSPEIPKF